MNQKKLDLQREVVRNERRQSYENEPYGMAELEVDGLMYPEGHPYHIPVIGTHEDLDRGDRRGREGLLRDLVRPEQRSLVVAGDFDPAATKKLIAALFGSLPKKPEPPHRDAAPVRLEKKKEKSLTDANVQFPRVSMIWHSPKALAPGDAECDLIGKILSDGIISRLQKRLIYDETLANSVMRVPAVAAARLALPHRRDRSPRASRLSRIEAAVDAELERLRKDGPTDAELTRVKAQLETETT